MAASQQIHPRMEQKISALNSIIRFQRQTLLILYRLKKLIRKEKTDKGLKANLLENTQRTLDLCNKYFSKSKLVKLKLANIKNMQKVIDSFKKDEMGNCKKVAEAIKLCKTALNQMLMERTDCKKANIDPPPVNATSDVRKYFKKLLNLQID